MKLICPHEFYKSSFARAFKNRQIKILIRYKKFSQFQNVNSRYLCLQDKDLIVCKNFKLVKKLGTGAFGQIYLAQNRSNKDEKYAAKLQEASTKFPQLYFEAKIYKYLTSSGNIVGIPKVHAMTTQGKYNVMLMDLLGKSLEDLFVDRNKKFSLKTALMLGKQMIDRIEFLHQRQIIHRDIKPDNFLMGIGKNSHIVYMIDLGLSKKYIKDSNISLIKIDKHIPYKEGKELTGTARYASINTHMGIQQARRDDIESIGYVIMYFLRGILPWQNMKAKDTKAKYQMILEKKISTPADILCKGFPNEIAVFINYAKGLKFQQKPDYNYLRSLLNSAKKANKIVTDHVYDWTGQHEQIETKQFLLGTKKSEPINKQLQNQTKPFQQQKLSTALTLQKDKKNIQPHTKYSSMNKNVITNVNAGNIMVPGKQTPVGIGGSTLNSRNQLRNTKSKMKTNTQIGGFGPSSLEALGSKIVGPKISVVKR